MNHRFLFEKFNTDIYLQLHYNSDCRHNSFSKTRATSSFSLALHVARFSTTAN